jgi:hypothetical protein
MGRRRPAHKLLGLPTSPAQQLPVLHPLRHHAVGINKFTVERPVARSGARSDETIQARSGEEHVIQVNPEGNMSQMGSYLALK